VAAPVAVTPPPPAKAAAPAPVEFKVTSTPPGAEVFRAADGVLLGETPFATSAAPSTGIAVFRLKLGGFDDARAELPADRGGAVAVTLVRTKVKTPRPGHGERPATPHKRVGDGAVDPF
jgi:hypothetical protein